VGRGARVDLIARTSHYGAGYNVARPAAAGAAAPELTASWVRRCRRPSRCPRPSGPTSAVGVRAGSRGPRLQCSNFARIFIGMHRNATLSPMKRVPGYTIPMVRMHLAPAYGSYEPCRENSSMGPRTARGGHVVGRGHLSLLNNSDTRHSKLVRVIGYLRILSPTKCSNMYPRILTLATEDGGCNAWPRKPFDCARILRPPGGNPAFFRIKPEAEWDSGRKR
jgi:hypothetical protein